MTILDYYYCAQFRGVHQQAQRTLSTHTLSNISLSVTFVFCNYFSSVNYCVTPPGWSIFPRRALREISPEARSSEPNLSDIPAFPKLAHPLGAEVAVDCYSVGQG